MELTREHFRTIIYNNFRRGLSQDKCLSELVSIYDVEAPSQTTIYRWYAEFRRGRVSLSTVSSAGRPRTAVTPENIAAVRTIILDDRHVTCEQIRAVISIEMTAIQSILHNELCKKASFPLGSPQFVRRAKGGSYRLVPEYSGTLQRREVKCRL
ncbi:unnamed protein product [Parnassius mnemosyne]|uniref:Mos1 transposase HTH domain-containing protein n=1 Tax=Parnassius mnemosyne TaxID=213953 RepID=A0AAV1KLL2_9NEOP